MVTKPIRIAHIGDVHLGHRHVPARFIVANLEKYLLNPTVFEKIDLVLIQGDLFDRLLSLDNADMSAINRFYYVLFFLAHKYGVIIRCMEGTPFHDRKQNNNLLDVYQTLSQENKISVDFKYVNDISFELIRPINLSVLYIPDEIRPNAAQTLIDAKKCLQSAGVEKADIVSIHGFFKHQLPEIAHTHRVLDQKEWQALCCGYISINHIHTHSVYENIIAPGSFDRLKHLEPEDKGYVIVTFDPDSKAYEYEFIKNDNAKQFVTIKITNADYSKALDKIDNTACKLRPSSYIRIVASAEHAIHQSTKELRQRYPTLHWSFDKPKDTSKPRASKKQIKWLDLVDLNSNTIIQCVRQHVLGKHDQRTAQQVVAELEIIMQANS